MCTGQLRAHRKSSTVQALLVRSCWPELLALLPVGRSSSGFGATRKVAEGRKQRFVVQENTDVTKLGPKHASLPRGLRTLHAAYTLDRQQSVPGKVVL